MTSAETSRPPLDQSAVSGLGAPWTRVEVVDEATSTNALVAARAVSGEAEGLVLVAEHQTAGRGRLDRRWEAPPRAGLTFSVLLRPAVPVLQWSWLPLLAGVAVVDAVADSGGPACALKWPNDVTCAGRKLGGLLVERVEGGGGAAAVLGIGLNVTTRRDELPLEAATSLLLEGAPVERGALLRGLLDRLGRRYLDWVAVGGRATPALVADYRARCATVGQQVRAHLPDGSVVEGTAEDVGADGALVVRSGSGPVVVRAGDVVHVRPLPGLQGPVPG